MYTYIFFQYTCVYVCVCGMCVYVYVRVFNYYP